MLLCVVSAGSSYRCFVCECAGVPPNAQCLRGDPGVKEGYYKRKTIKRREMFSYKFLPKDEIFVGVHHRIDTLESGKTVHCLGFGLIFILVYYTWLSKGGS